MLRRCPKPRESGFGRTKRDDISVLEGRFFGATLLPVTDRNHTRLAGSQSEAQPPGAKMAVREKSVARENEPVKRAQDVAVDFLMVRQTVVNKTFALRDRTDLKVDHYNFVAIMRRRR
jgi:hypothetical protein